MSERKNADKRKPASEAVTLIPRNFFQRDVFLDGLPERHEYEQFFWNRDTVERLIKACEYQFTEETCCLTTPSLAHEWHARGRDEVLLDIDTRFDYLPKFRYYDVRDPHALPDSKFRLLIIDPPFFAVPIEQFRVAVDVLTNKDYDTRILLAFLRREEGRLLSAFKDYDLRVTNCALEYASIKPNKWKNFALYSNVDLPGIKRVHTHT